MTATASDLLREIDQLDLLQADIRSIRTRKDDGRAHDLVRMRRALADHINHLSSSGEGALQSPEMQATRMIFRQRLSLMRAKLAIHQSSFPASMLKSTGPEYRASALEVDELIAELVSWARQALR